MKVQSEIRGFIGSLNATYEWAVRQGWHASDRKFVEAMADTMESEMKRLRMPGDVVETLFSWVVDPNSLPYSVEYGLMILGECS